MSPSDLCRRCGLCCDGNLFTQVPLADDEVAGLRRRGLVVLARADGSHALKQPCAALADHGCTIYEERPHGCRRYRCMLLAALAEQEVAPDEALAVVERAHVLLAAAGASREPGDARRAREFVERRFRGCMT